MLRVGGDELGAGIHLPPRIPRVLTTDRQRLAVVAAGRGTAGYDQQDCDAKQGHGSLGGSREGLSLADRRTSASSIGGQQIHRRRPFAGRPWLAIPAWHKIRATPWGRLGRRGLAMRLPSLATLAAAAAAFAFTSAPAPAFDDAEFCVAAKEFVRSAAGDVGTWTDRFTRNDGVDIGCELKTVHFKRYYKGPAPRDAWKERQAEIWESGATARCGATPSATAGWCRRVTTVAASGSGSPACPTAAASTA
jgi:hypothetical protein